MVTGGWLRVVIHRHVTLSLNLLGMLSLSRRDWGFLGNRHKRHKHTIKQRRRKKELACEKVEIKKNKHKEAWTYPYTIDTRKAARIEDETR